MSRKRAARARAPRPAGEMPRRAGRAGERQLGGAGAPRSLGVILPAVVGDLVNLPGWDRSYVLDRVCAPAHPSTSRYACLTCRQLLANEANLVFHLEPSGQHVVARLCLEHGWEAVSRPPEGAP